MGQRCSLGMHWAGCGRGRGHELLKFMSPILGRETVFTVSRHLRSRIIKFGKRLQNFRLDVVWHVSEGVDCDAVTLQQLEQVRRKSAGIRRSLMVTLEHRSSMLRPHPLL
jgi:hypothetical protein